MSLNDHNAKARRLLRAIAKKRIEEAQKQYSDRKLKNMPKGIYKRKSRCNHRIGYIEGRCHECRKEIAKRHNHKEESKEYQRRWRLARYHSDSEFRNKIIKSVNTYRNNPQNSLKIKLSKRIQYEKFISEHYMKNGKWIKLPKADYETKLELEYIIEIPPRTHAMVALKRIPPTLLSVGFLRVNE